MKKTVRSFIGVARVLAVLIAGGVLSLQGQTITGSIAGSVVDPSGLAVTKAKVAIENPSTSVRRESETDAKGDFVFAGVEPGQYNLTVTAPGFKTAERRGVQLSAFEKLSLGNVSLAVGSISESVTVTAQGATVQTASAERAGVVTSSQVDNLLVQTRRAMSLLQLLPGVVDTDTSTGMNRYWYTYVQGGRYNTSNMAVDGMPLNNFGNGINSVVGVSQDAVAEVKVLLSNYQAEYGRMSGANVTLVTKSGTRDFHGLGSYFKRHEQFNANNFFNNRNGTSKSRYRYNTWTYNVGGPVYIPGKFNTQKDKLFFFWSQEYWPTKAGLTGRVTTPTALERTGDFSQSIDLNSKLITVKDPTTSAAFPGNVIPTTRLNASGVALLNVFPLPNFTNRAVSNGNYNYIWQNDETMPQRMETLRFDYNINSNNQLAFTYSGYNDDEEGATGVLTASGVNWPQMRKGYYLHGRMYTGRYTHIFTPTLINELTLGMARRPEGNKVIESALKKVQRDTVGFTAGQLYPAANPYNLIPAATYGGVTGAATLTEESRFPFEQRITPWTLTDNLSKTFGSHMAKVGMTADWVATRAVSYGGKPFGSFTFSTNSTNPLDTGYAYANGALGVFYSYTEASSRPIQHSRQRNVEWFVQDNWRVNRRLTLDYGVRFYWIDPVYDRDDAVSGFVPSAYTSADAVKLIQPVMLNGKRAGVNPNTGAYTVAAMIGAIASGAGSPYNGMVVASQNKSYPHGMIDNRGIQVAPRAGFAYDVFGNAKTAIRGGFGTFYNRHGWSIFNGLSALPPLVDNPTLYYGDISTFLSSAGVLFPSSVTGLDRIGKVPTVMNYSFSVQQNVGFGTVVDVGYVGSLGRHLLWARNLNSIPLGANFKSENIDPTTGSAYSAAFLRPLTGYGDIAYYESASSSNYNSLQVSVNRRFAKGVQFGANWTWSKALDYNDNDTDAVTTLLSPRVWNYGLASFDRTHVVKINYVWDVPNSPFKNSMLKQVFNGWQVSGITSFISGSPLGVGFTTTDSHDITGTVSLGARIVVNSNPVLPKGERTFDKNFRTDVFAMPAKGTIGNAAKTLIRGPGVNNFDTAVFKNFPVTERMRMQFRWEMYNAFNHTQFSGLNATAKFDTAGNQINSSFGMFTSARDPRIMQFALRFYF